MHKKAFFGRGTPKGIKFDQEKDQWSLLPWETLRDVVRVLMHGARKYSPDNWKYVKNGRIRYFDACQRHLTAWWEGERYDPESGLHHLAHAICCLMFALWHDKQNLAQKTNFLTSKSSLIK